jgi:hypothetical protein
MRDLRARREDLAVAVQQAAASAPDTDEIAEMRHHIEKAVTDGAVPARKALLQALVHEIRVEGRDRVVPWFRVPGGADPKVGALARSAPPGGLEPPTRCLEGSRSVQLSYRGSSDMESLSKPGLELNAMLRGTSTAHLHHH